MTSVLDLHRWRRLDWRFLVPLADPARLAVGGRPDPDLVTAARAFDPAATDLADATAGNCDLVLLAGAGAGADDVDLAGDRLAADGWICVEVTRSTSRPRTLRGWAELLRSKGFRDVEIFWHVPTLATSTRIVAIEQRAVVRATLARHQNLRFGRLRAVVAKTALRLGLFDLLVPEGTVVGRAPVSAP